ETTLKASGYRTERRIRWSEDAVTMADNGGRRLCAHRNTRRPLALVVERCQESWRTEGRRMQPLVSADWLVDHLDDPEVIVLEVSSEPEPGAAYFRDGHIPGSRFAWWKTLSWDESDRDFPPPEEMAQRLRSLGVSDDSRLVLVGDPIQFATYPYWVLALSGLDHVASLLDGGRRNWVARG